MSGRGGTSGWSWRARERARWGPSGPHVSLPTAGPLLHRSDVAEAAGRWGLRRRRRIPGSSASSRGGGGCCCCCGCYCCCCYCGGSAPLPFSPCRTRGPRCAWRGRRAGGRPPPEREAREEVRAGPGGGRGRGAGPAGRQAGRQAGGDGGAPPLLSRTLGVTSASAAPSQPGHLFGTARTTPPSATATVLRRRRTLGVTSASAAPSQPGHLFGTARTTPPSATATVLRRRRRRRRRRLPAQPRFKRAHPARPPPPPPSAHDQARCRPLPRAWPPSRFFSRRSSSVGPGLLRPQ